MKKSHAYLLLIALKTGSVTSLLKGCPTCVGKITPQSPTFFSNQFYSPHSEPLNPPSNDLTTMDTEKETDEESDD